MSYVAETTSDAHEEKSPSARNLALERHPLERHRVVLVGNPNTGKSTLFGVLSGIHVHVANYPGVTTEKKSARLADPRLDMELIDLPGTYSLSPRSPDELVAVEVLTGEVPGEPPPDLIVCVVNATLLRRNLFLVSQLLELGRPVVVALNMTDAAEARGLSIRADRLASNLGVPVVPISASKRIGIDGLRDRIIDRLKSPSPPEPTRPLPERFYQLCDAFFRDAGDHHDSGSKGRLPSRFVFRRAVLDRGGEAERQLLRCLPDPESLEATRKQIEEELGPLSDLDCDSRYAWAARQVEGVISEGADSGHRATEVLDRVLVHRVWGLTIFAAVMFVIFQLIFAWSKIPMNTIESAQETASGWVEGMMEPGTLRSLLTDGVIAGVGSVLVFLPQIALLFLFLALLEDCGYMARAAFLVDRVMAMFGLSGKSFLPLMSSFACAVPGIMATRVIENRRDRFTTILIAPFMSCSARLPVYLLLIAAFFPAVTFLGGWVSLSGLVLMGMYFVGVAVAIPTAWLLKRTVLRGEAAPFVLEMPEYKVPGVRIVIGRVWEACKAFVLRAGTLIFAASIVVWALAYWPGDHSRRHELQRLVEANREHEEIAGVTGSESDATAAWAEELQLESSRLLETSFLGRLGHAIEPAVRPLGWDWKIGVGVLAAFPAREVIIATLGTIYSLGGEVTEDDPSLITAMQEATWPDGRPVYNPAVALSIMVFFALCAQCVSTLLIIRRETNSWRWPIFSFVYMTGIAYLGALVTYQVAVRLIA